MPGMGWSNLSDQLSGESLFESLFEEFRSALKSLKEGSHSRDPSLIRR